MGADSGKRAVILLRRAPFALAVLLCAAGAAGQEVSRRDAMTELSSFSQSIEALTARVSPSVVRILVTGYGSSESSGGRTDMTIGRQQSIGSGVIIDSDGYIITNAHVVEGAQKIKVNLFPKGQQTISSVVAHSYAPPVDATLLGTFKEGDLALLKIAGSGLPALRFADYSKLRQGQMVLAFGSPAGLENSVSMGIVSSIARQSDPDSPMLYIQTDTPINPGNSGGPLLNTAGEIVGLNTFIVSKSGGNEGVGFAIPSLFIEWVYGQLRKYGHVHHAEIGISLQTITPTLAAALALPRPSGVVISDVMPGGPAEASGLKIGDVMMSVDGTTIDTVPAMMGFFFQQGAKNMKFKVLRGHEQLDFDVLPVEKQHEADRLADFADPSEGLIAPLGIMGITVDQRVAQITGSLRFNSGVIVANRVQNITGLETGLQTSDIIHAVNGEFVLSLDALRTALGRMKSGQPVALMVERGGQLNYVSFEMP